MGNILFLPTTFKARLVLAGVLALSFILGSTFYLQLGDLPSFQRQGRPFGSHNSSLSTNDNPASPNARIVLVSAFFPLPNSKMSKPEYDVWLKNYLGTVTTDIYLYTTPELRERVKGFRGDNLPLTIDTTYSSPFDIPPLKDKEEAYTKIRKKVKPRHSIESYAFANSKSFFLHKAVLTLSSQGLKYDYAFWNDAGSFHKEHEYRDWPSPERVEEVMEEGAKLSGTKKEELIFVPMTGVPHKSMTFWQENMGPAASIFSEGNFFGGAPGAIEWLARAYYTYHDHYLSFELFIGKDEANTNALIFLFPERFVTVWYNDPEAPAHLALKQTRPDRSFLGQCGSEWFYYQFWLADLQEKHAMREQWQRKVHAWPFWGWWRDKTRCQDTRLLTMRDVLRRTFSDGWKPPSRRVNLPESLQWK